VKGEDSLGNEGRELTEDRVSSWVDGGRWFVPGYRNRNEGPVLARAVGGVRGQKVCNNFPVLQLQAEEIPDLGGVWQTE